MGDVRCPLLLEICSEMSYKMTVTPIEIVSIGVSCLWGEAGTHKSERYQKVKEVDNNLIAR